MKKIVTQILCLFLLVCLIVSCKSFCEKRIKKMESNLSQEEKDRLFFARLSSFVGDEDVAGFSSLFEAVSLQDVKRIINKTNKSGRTLLHFSVLLENVELTRLILSANPDRTIRDNYNKTAEDYARENKNKAILSLLGTIDEKMQIKEEQKEVKKEVPPKRTKPKYESGKKETGGSLSSIPITIDTVAYSYDVLLGDSKSPFLKAVKEQNMNEVESLLDGGKNVNETDSLGNNAIFYALLSDNTQILNLLIRRGINCNYPNQAGRYPLLYAVDKLDSNVVKALVDAGANVNVSDNEGLTAVMIASYRKSVAMLKALNRYNASFSVKDGRGNTPLHIALQNEDVAMIKFLLKQMDVDVYEPNDAGLTSLDMMRSSKNPQIKRMANTYKDE